MFETNRNLNGALIPPLFSFCCSQEKYPAKIAQVKAASYVAKRDGEENSHSDVPFSRVFARE